MIRLVRRGDYKLIEVPDCTKLLVLNGKGKYLWLNEKLGLLRNAPQKGRILCLEKYRLYEAKDEPRLEDGIHLELCLGSRVWQGYLLPGGFPEQKAQSKKIIPAKTVITKTSRISLN